MDLKEIEAVFELCWRASARALNEPAEDGLEDHIQSLRFGLLNNQFAWIVKQFDFLIDLEGELQDIWSNFWEVITLYQEWQKTNATLRMLKSVQSRLETEEEIQKSKLRELTLSSAKRLR